MESNGAEWDFLTATFITEPSDDVNQGIDYGLLDSGDDRPFIYLATEQELNEWLDFDPRGDHFD